MSAIAQEVLNDRLRAIFRDECDGEDPSGFGHDLCLDIGTSIYTCKNPGCDLKVDRTTWLKI